MTDLFVETWEEGTDGVAVTATNSSFSGVFNSGGTLTFSTNNLTVYPWTRTKQWLRSDAWPGPDTGTGLAGEGFPSDMPAEIIAMVGVDNFAGHLQAAGNYILGQATFTAANKVFISVPLRSVGPPGTSVPIVIVKGNNKTAQLGGLRLTTDRKLVILDPGFGILAQSPVGLVADGQNGRVELLVDTVNEQYRARYFSSVTGTTPAWDSGLVTSAVALGFPVDTVNIGATGATTWEAYLGDIYVSNTAWHSYVDNPTSGTISHVGSASAQIAGTGATVSVTAPAGIQGQDLMILQFIGSQTTVWTDSPPAGWTAIPIAQTGGLPKFRAWVKSAAGSVGSASSDAGSTVTVTSNNNSGTYYRNLHLNVYRAAKLGDASSRMATVISTQHSTPAVVTVDPTAWIHAGCADRDAPGSSAFTASTGLTERTEQDAPAGTSSSVASVTASDDLVGSGSPSTYTFTGTLSTDNAVTWAIALEPNSVTPPVNVSAGPDFSAEPWTTATITPTASGTVTSWSWQQISPVDPDIVTGATVDSNGTIHLAFPGLLALTQFTLRVIGHVTGVTTDAFDDMVVTVYPATRRFVMDDGTEVPLRVEWVT